MKTKYTHGIQEISWLLMAWRRKESARYIQVWAPMGSADFESYIDSSQIPGCDVMSTKSGDVMMSTMASQITGVRIVYLTRLFRRRSKKTSKLRDTSLCEGNSPVNDEFPAQRASNTEKLSIWWRHHGVWYMSYCIINATLPQLSRQKATDKQSISDFET